MRAGVSDNALAADGAGGLTATGRRKVEGVLACNPGLAARVMTNLHPGGAPTWSRGRTRLLLRAGAVAPAIPEPGVWRQRP
jgi:hypothetical protein